MNDPRDLVLQHALRRVLGPEEGVDLSGRILAAWRRGIPGSIDVDRHALRHGANGSEPDASPPEGSGPNGYAREGGWRRERLRPVPLLLAAAAVLALIALGARLFRLPAGAPAFAVASADVELLAGGGAEGGPAREIAPGDAFLVEPGPVELSLAGGATLIVESGSVLRAGERQGVPVFALELGSVELRAGPGPVEIVTGFATLRAEPGTVLAAAVALDPAPLDPVSPGAPLPASGRQRALALLDPAFAGRRELSVEVASGAADLEHGGTRLRVVPTAGSRTVSGPLLLAEADSERFDALFEQLFVDRAASLEKGYEERKIELEELARILGRSRPLWSRLEHRLAEARRAPEAAPELSRPVIDFLAGDPSEEALELARRLWMDVPEAFREEHLVAFAERGAFEFQREIEALVATYDPDEPSVPVAPERAPPVLAAAHLAFQGESAGRAILRHALEEGPEGTWDRPLAFLAALALDRLGERDAWPRALGLLHERVEASLDGFDTITGARLVLTFELFHGIRSSHAVPALGTLWREVRDYVAARGNEVQSEAAIRALVDRLGD